jgi:phytoene dehydrogenase-like protein
MAGGRVLIVGGGHNGLVCAAYLARAGMKVTLLERRPVLGGACVTEELWPGFRISRAAYVVGLLRPQVVRELELRRFGLELIPRDPASITLLPDGRSLVLGANPESNAREVARFSKRDADRLPDYERFLARVAGAIDPLLDTPPPVWPLRRPRDLRVWAKAARATVRLRRDLPRASRLLLAPARELLEEWFESEPLRSTLATDAVIGAWASPSSPGTGYVLFHHVMGTGGGRPGVWSYVRGGMGQLAAALADSVRASGGEIRTEADVTRIRVEGSRAVGVELQGGERLDADVVVSNADPHHTFFDLIGEGKLPESDERTLGQIDFRSPVLKINLAMEGLPPFRFPERDTPPPLAGTLHIGCPDLDSLDRAFEDARSGRLSEHPMVELTVPSALDSTLAPEGRHVVSIFAQYAPSLGSQDPSWARIRDEARDRVLHAVEEVAPGFTSRILHLEVLTPPDLEKTFGLKGGNIFHGAMRPDRLLFLRPVAGWDGYRTPIERLFLCGAGTHPGGGVMGACGRNAAGEILTELRGRARSRDSD